MKTYTKEEVIDFILQERNRCREICDGHKSWYERRVKEFGEYSRRSHEEGMEACRRVRNDIGDYNPLVDERTDSEKVIERYNL